MSSEQKKDNSRIILAFVLIGIGVVWILRRIGFYINFPQNFWENIFYPIRHIFHVWGHFIFSWPMVLIVIGIILIAGRRRAGIVFVIVGGIFILPRIFFIPGLTTSLLLPVLLVGIGVAMVARFI
ncbi:MAG: hypothetical protein J7L95_01535 [Prolixibacteraceae bacterium]|nr:hypothetical protein [Prolixibacteraceae bacterium]